VRELRTPGSVRGALSNERSYRDTFYKLLIGMMFQDLKSFQKSMLIHFYKSLNLLILHFTNVRFFPFRELTPTNTANVICILDGD
jgi:hypothetical protein